MKSLFQLALLLSILAAMAAPTEASAQACVYGTCSATVCGTNGTRPAINQPCLGAPSIVCSAPACPACTYASCTATVCGTSGTQTANNQPCTGATSISCTAPACPACSYGTCSATVCGTSGTQTAINQPCTGSSSISCDAQACTADYSYTGASFNVVSGSRFSATDSVTASFSVDCQSAGGAGDCRSLAFADHAAVVTACDFTASGSPDLQITCADALPGYFFNFETDADGQLSGSYNIALESSLEGENGARITTSSSGGFTVARPGATNGEGRVDYAPGLWEGLLPLLPTPVPVLSPRALGALAILLGAMIVGRRAFKARVPNDE